MTDKTELERLQKLVLDAKVAYKAARSLNPEYYNNLDGIEACNTTSAAWLKLEQELANYLKEQNYE